MPISSTATGLSAPANNYGPWRSPRFGIRALLHSHVSNWLETSWPTRLTTPHAGYPVPIPTALHAGVHFLFGYEASAFHAMNVVVHACNAVLVYWLFRRLGIEVGAACVAGLLWAVHPVVVEPVAWVTGLKDLISMTGVLLALIGATGLAREEGSASSLVLLVIGPLIAMGGKPTGVVVGPMILAFALITLRESPHPKKMALWWGVWWTAVGALVAAWSYRSHGEFGGQDTTQFAMGRILRAVEVTLQNYLAPVNLSPRYLYESPGAATYILGLAVVAVAAALIWKSWHDERPLVCLGLSWAALAFAPVSNVIPLNRFVADSYLYTPSLGIVLALVAWLGRSPSPLLGLSPLRRRAIVVAILALLGIFSAVHTTHWRSSTTLWQYAVQIEPDDPMAHLKLGQAHFEEERYELAIEHFESLYTTVPDFHIPPARWPLAHCALGNTDRCANIFTELIERTPPGETPSATRNHQFLVVSYGWAAHHFDLRIEETLDAQTRHTAAEVRRLAKEGRTVEEVMEGLDRL